MTFVENAIRNQPKYQEPSFWEMIDSCFSSICKFGSFKNPFATIISLSEIYFRFRRLILLVQMKKEPDLCQMKQKQKLCITTKKVIDRGKRSNTLSEVRPVENISKNLQSFLQICLVQKKVLPSHKLPDHVCECQNPLRLKEDNPSQINSRIK